MTDRIESACLSELERVLEEMFEGAATIPIKDAPGRYFGYDPILGRLFIDGEDHAQLRLAICRALVADAKFRVEKPSGWPDHLPLRKEEISAMIDCDNVQCNVVGYYGSSLHGEGWHPDHPPFAAFVSGLLACRGTPDEIRCNPELRREFPPVKLKGMYKGLPPYIFNGLVYGGPYWRSPETIAADRFVDRKVAEHEARVAAGTAVGP